MMNLGYSGPVGLPISVSFPVLLIPAPPLTPIPALATTPSCPFVTVSGGAHQGPGDVPLHFLRETGEKCVQKCVISKSSSRDFLWIAAVY